MEEYEHPTYEEMISTIMNILKEMNQWNINQETLIQTKELLEYEKIPLIGINSKFDELIVSLTIAVSDD